MKRAVLGMALAALAIMAGKPATAGMEPYLGELTVVSYSDWCPHGTMPANGQVLPINQNQALFALLGTRYGGNGRATFALPKANNTTSQGLQGVGLAPGLYYCIAMQGIFPSRP